MMRRSLLLLFSLGILSCSLYASDPIEPVTGLPQSTIKPLIERQAQLDNSREGMALRTAIFSLFSPVMQYDSEDAVARKIAVQEAFFANEQIPTREDALVADRAALKTGHPVPSRWFTFLWSDLVGTAERPSFAPELLRELEVKGWGEDNGQSFDIRSRRARNLLVFLEEHEQSILPLAKKYHFDLLGTGRHSIVMHLKEGAGYVCKVLRNKWAFPFQSLSRAFWAHSLRVAIAEKGLDEYIIVPDVYLVNVNGLMTFTVDTESVNWPALIPHDRNYVVVERFIPNFPTKTENIHRWQTVTPGLVCAVATAIKEAGIWDVRATTIDLIEHTKEDGETSLKAHFTHLECPGRGGYTTKDFYRRTPETTERLAQDGLDGLAKMLTSRLLEDSRVIEVLGVDRVHNELVARGEREVVPNELGV